MFRTTKQFIILAFVFFATLSLCKYFELSITVADRSAEISLGGSISSISATMLGFLLAALAVLASINNTHLITIMKKTGHYDDLLSTTFLGAAIFVICLIVGFSIMFGVKAEPIGWAIISIHVTALFSLIDICRKFILVLTNLKN